MNQLQIVAAEAPGAGAIEQTSGRAAMLLGVLWIAGAYATFLRYNAYPLWRLDVLIGIAMLSIGPIAIGWVYGRLGRLARACVLGLFAYIVLRMNGAGHNWSLTGGIAVGIAAYFAEAVVIGFGTVMAAVVLGWAMLGLSERTPPIIQEGSFNPVEGRSGPPPIVHLILDEHGGKPAFDLVDRHAPGTWAAVEKAYLKRGFSVWPNAYSRHFFSVNSVPEILGLGKTELRSDKPGGTAGTLAIVDRLAGSGYRVHVWQTSFQELCDENRVSSCTTYGYASLAEIDELPVLDRVKLSLGAFATMPRAAVNALKSYNRFALRARESGVFLPRWSIYWLAKPAPLNSKMALERLTKRLSQIQRGEAVIAHLLIPHFPFALDRDCRVKPYRKWHVRISEAPTADRAVAYAEQVICTTRLVEQAIAAAGPDAIIILHGDHGPRIFDRELTSMSLPRGPDQLAAGYSTLFALRLPGQPPRIEGSQKPVSMLLTELAEAGWRRPPSLPSPDRPKVMLHGTPPNPMVETQLPDWEARANGDSPSR